MALLEVLTTISLLLPFFQKSPEPPPPEQFGANVPNSESGRPVPLVFGTVLISDPFVMWYGRERADKIKGSKSNPFGSREVLGYNYTKDLQLGLAEGLDSITGCRLNGSRASFTIQNEDYYNFDIFQDEGFTEVYWAYLVSTSGVRNPNFTGGNVVFYRGGQTHKYLEQLIESQYIGGVNPFDTLLGSLSAPRYAFISTLFLTGRARGFYQSGVFNTYRTQISSSGGFSLGASNRSLPRMEFYVENFFDRGGAYLDGDIRRIGTFDINPVEVIYHILVGESRVLPSEIDDVSFGDVAQLLFDEGLGISVYINEDIARKDFLTELCELIDVDIYFNLSDRKFKLRSFRFPTQTEIDDAPLIDESIIIDIRRYDLTSTEDIVNVVRFEYTNRTNSYRRTTAIEADAALVASMSRIEAYTFRSDFVHTASVAQLLAARTLAVRSRPIASIRVVTQRHMSGLLVGDLVKLTYDAFNLSERVFRVARINIGARASTPIIIDLIEVIRDGVATFNAEAATEWVDPNAAPLDTLTQIAAVAMPSYFRNIINQQLALEVTELRPRIMSLVGLEQSNLISSSTYADGDFHVRLEDFMPTATIDGAVTRPVFVGEIGDYTRVNSLSGSGQIEFDLDNEIIYVALETNDDVDESAQLLLLGEQSLAIYSSDFTKVAIFNATSAVTATHNDNDVIQLEGSFEIFFVDDAEFELDDVTLSDFTGTYSIKLSNTLVTDTPLDSNTYQGVVDNDFEPPDTYYINNEAFELGFNMGLIANDALGDQEFIGWRFESGTNLYLVERGLFSTCPKPHADGARVFAFSSISDEYENEFVFGYTNILDTSFKTLSDIQITGLFSTGFNLLSDATEILTYTNIDQTDDNAQVTNPAYVAPARDVRVNGLGAGATVDGSADIVFTWKHSGVDGTALRTTFEVQSDEGLTAVTDSIQYRVGIFVDGTEVRNFSLTGSTYTWTSTDSDSDLSEPDENVDVTLQLQTYAFIETDQISFIDYYEVEFIYMPAEDGE